MAGPVSEQHWAQPFAGALVPNGASLAPTETLAEFAASSASVRDPGGSTPMADGTPHVVVQFATARCLLPLSDLRGVLTETPKLVRFPFSRPWLLGVFLFRAELIAVVDPLPVLFAGMPYDATSSQERTSLTTSGGERPTILVGGDERTLGFRVDGVFEVIFVVEGSADTTSPVPRERYAPIEGRYIEAFWSPEPGSPATPILAVRPLLDDLLLSVSEEGRDG